MQTNLPNEALDLIRSKSVQFALSDADDPKSIVDEIMADIETALQTDHTDQRAYLDEVAGKTKFMLASMTADEPSLPDKHKFLHGQRQVMFLRSMVQLLESRRSISI